VRAPEAPSEQWDARCAREMNLSETAFLVPREEWIAGEFLRRVSAGGWL